MFNSVAIVYNVTSGNTINVLRTAIASDSFLVSKQVLRGRQIISYNKGVVLVNLLIW